MNAKPNSNGKNRRSPQYSYSELLFAQPSFVEGAARVLDLGATLTSYNDCLTVRDADHHALRADLLAVASDIRATRARLARDAANKVEQSGQRAM